MDKETLQTLKQQLESEKKRLEEQLSSFAKRDPHAPDNWETKYPQMENQGNTPGSLEEQEDEVEEYTTRLSLESALEARLKEVHGALQRMEEGTYGKCRQCGKDITIERLTVSPTAILGEECMKK